MRPSRLDTPVPQLRSQGIQGVRPSPLCPEQAPERSCAGPSLHALPSSGRGPARTTLSRRLVSSHMGSSMGSASNCLTVDMQRHADSQSSGRWLCHPHGSAPPRTAFSRWSAWRGSPARGQPRVSVEQHAHGRTTLKMLDLAWAGAHQPGRPSAGAWSARRWSPARGPPRSRRPAAC